MKKVIKSVFYIATVIQLLVSFIVYSVNAQYIYVAGKVLGKDEPLPMITEAVLKYAPGCSLLFVVLFLGGALKTNKTKNESLIIYMSLLFIIELVLLSLVGVGYMRPTCNVMWELGV